MTLLDVREDWEIALAPVPSPHLHIPMGRSSSGWRELDPQATTVVICRSGGRSLQVARFLAAPRLRLGAATWPAAFSHGPGTSTPGSLSIDRVI